MRRTLAVLLGMTALLGVWLGPWSSATAADPTFPLRGTFYYGWFPETWGNLASPDSRYQPTRGYYSTDLATATAQVTEMQSANIDFAIASWWGQGSNTDDRMGALLRAADGTDFKWAVYYEPEGYSDPSSSTIASDLSYIRDRYGSDPNYLRIGGRFVVFVYAGSDGCPMASRWNAGNTVGAYLVLKVFSGFRTCTPQPDSWHQYGPATMEQAHLPYSYAISPGFWRYDEASPRLARNLGAFQAAVANMVASGASWQLVTTWNEFGEGSPVEPTTAFGTTYLDALRCDGVCVTPTSPPPTSPPPTSPPPTSPPPTSPPPTSPPPTTGFRLAAAGDICGNCKATSDLVLANSPLVTLTLGDNAYDAGTLSEYNTKYDPNWGRFKATTRPSPGNHEWNSSNAQGYRDYFGITKKNLWGAFNVGGWHFVRMDTTKMSSTQVSWIQRNLARDTHTCEVAYGHHPRWSSGSTHGSQTSQSTAWGALAAGNVDIVLYGHEHNYERFGLIDGMREFVVGTGGAGSYGFGSPVAGSQVRITNVQGVLFLTLGSATYSWQFKNTAGTVLDSGSGACH